MKKILVLLLTLVVWHTQAQTSNTAIPNDLLAYNSSSNTALLNYTKNYQPTRSSECMNGYAIGAYVFGAAGGALIGYPLGTALGGGDPEWLLAGIGAGCLAIAIPLSIIGQRKCDGRASIQKDQEMYYAQAKRSLNLNMVANRSGIGLALNF
ncbi:MAG: hypothetical protein R2800_08950 [Flavipsychrobacter sp.]